MVAMAPASKDRDHKYLLRVRTETFEELRERAALRGISTADLINEVLEHHVNGVEVRDTGAAISDSIKSTKKKAKKR
jgi:hypothetical protein